MQLQVQYKSYSDLDAEKSWWTLPSFTDLLQMGRVGGAYNKVFGEDGIKASDFVRSTLGSLSFLLNDDENSKPEEVQSPEKLTSGTRQNEIAQGITSAKTDSTSDLIVRGTTPSAQPFNWFGFGKAEQAADIEKEKEKEKENGDLEDDHEGDYVGAVVQAVGRTLASIGVDVGSLPSFDRNALKADGEAIKKLSSEFQSKADADYVESGLALPNGQITESPSENDSQVRSGHTHLTVAATNLSLIKLTEN